MTPWARDVAASRRDKLLRTAGGRDPTGKALIVADCPSEPRERGKSLQSLPIISTAMAAMPFRADSHRGSTSSVGFQSTTQRSDRPGRSMATGNGQRLWCGLPTGERYGQGGRAMRAVVAFPVAPGPLSSLHPLIGLCWRWWPLGRWSGWRGVTRWIFTSRRCSLGAAGNGAAAGN